jgi:nitrogen fixation protein NifB
LFENRPGVTGKVVAPQEALAILDKALVICPEITVAGIAGPGDTLASDDALETFRLIGKKYPGLLKCMSTNGLLLDEKADEILEAGLSTLTVTVNAVKPAIEARLNDYIIYHGKKYEGEEAAEILIANQLKGIRKMAGHGMVIKINTVLVPEINADHIEQIAKEVSEAGASIYNIIPLIPQGKLSGCAAPSCIEIEAARKKAEKYIDVFRHCQHCRADAAGLLGGKDISDKLYSVPFGVPETFSHG